MTEKKDLADRATQAMIEGANKHFAEKRAKQFAEMSYAEVRLPEFNIIGLPLRTDNSPAGHQKITAHWAKFYKENWLEKIPGKTSREIIAAYTDYEGPANKPLLKSYKLIVGAKVKEGVKAPEGLTALFIPPQTYGRFTAKGAMPQAIVKTWYHIWAAGIQRTFRVDFELMDERFMRGNESEADIYIGKRLDKRA